MCVCVCVCVCVCARAHSPSSPHLHALQAAIELDQSVNQSVHQSVKWCITQHNRSIQNTAAFRISSSLHCQHPSPSLFPPFVNQTHTAFALTLPAKEAGGGSHWDEISGRRGTAVCMASIRCTRCVNHLTGNHTWLAVARRPVIWLQTRSRLVAQSLITALRVESTCHSDVGQL